MIDVKLETPGLTLSDPILSKDNIYIDINGGRYVYTVKDEVDLSPSDIVKKVLGIKKYSDGRALSFLKKNCDGRKVSNEAMDDNFYTIPKSIPDHDLTIKNEVLDGMIDIIDKILINLDYQDERERYKIIFDVISGSKLSRIKDDLINALKEVI